MKRGRKLVITVAVLSLCMLLSACAKSRESGGENSEKTAQTVDDLCLKDSKVIYQDDDEDSVVTMYLTVRQGNEADNTNHTWSEVNAHSVYYYQERDIEKYRVAGIVQVGDENGPVMGMFGYNEYYPNCTVQMRGQTSTRSPQKSYKIEINKNEGYWREQRTIVLNKHVYDSVRFRNKLSYDLLKTIPGAFSARTQFVHLYVKDETEGVGKGFEDYGLFTQVEQINKTYLRNHGLDENGHLYKATMFEFLRYEDALKETSDPAYDKTAFEQVLEIKGNDDHSKLIAMLDDLNNYAIPIEEIMAKHFDEDNYFTWLAFQMLSGNKDTTSQNFYLYSPLNGNKWYFIPWDNDDAWSYGEEITYGGKTAGYNYTLGISNYWGCVLHQRVLKSEELRNKLAEKVEEIYKLISKEQVASMVTTYSNLVKPYMSKLPDQLYIPNSMEQFEQIIATIPDEMEYNYNYFKQSLECPMPFYTSAPENIAGKTVFSWEPAFDFKGEEVSYKFELARDYTFANVVNVQEKLAVPQAFVGQLAPGQYFFRVTGTNESGKTQTMMEIYRGIDDVERYGIVEFYVNADGSIDVR